MEPIPIICSINNNLTPRPKRATINPSQNPSALRFNNIIVLLAKCRQSSRAGFCDKEISK